MTKRITSVAASVKAAAGGGAAFVFASRASDLPDNDKQLNRVFASAKYSNFGCTACGTHMQARAETTPFCVTCGAGEQVHQVKANSEASITSSSELTALHCSVCDHETVLESAVVSSITASGEHPVHCSCCGKPMYQMEAAAAAKPGSAPTDKPAGAESATELVIPDEPPAIKAAGEEEVLDTDGDGDIDIDDLEAAFMGVSAKANDKDDEDKSLHDTDEKFGGKKAAPFEKKAGLEADGLVIPDTPTDLVSDDMVLEPFTMEEDFGDDVLDDPIAEVSTEEFADDEFGIPDMDGDPLADAMELDDTDAALAFVRASGRVIAMKGHVAIASFSKKTAGSNAFLINSDALPAAAKAAVNSEGLRKGLESVGFKLIRVPVSSALIVDKKVAAIQASVAKKEDQRRREFAGIVALAAAGLNRGNWRGFENPLRAALERELENIGVERPKRIAARILEESGLKYTQTLLEVSNKLSSMSASARKDMADSLEFTNVVASAEDDSEEETVTSSALEARLTKPALLRPAITSSAKGISGASAVLAGKAPLTFASA